MPNWKKVIVSGSNASLNSLNVATNVTAQSFTGSLFGTASFALNAGSGGGGGGVNITGSIFFVPVFNTTSSLVTSSIYDSGSFTAIGATASVDPSNPDRLFIDAGDTTSYNLLSGHGDINNYLQLNIRNFSAGATASSDIVATANNGDETNFYVDLGINSSGYNVPNGVGSANDSYLYNLGGDLLIGNASTNKRIILFNGGTPALENARIYITQQGTVGINASDTNDNNPEALLVEPLPGSPSNTFKNLIIGRGTIHESYLQLNIINQGTGSYASADIVATNNIGTETSNYIDMGINSSNHIVDTTFAPGGPNDTYLLSTGRDLLIGSSTSGSIILWTGTDFNDKANAKLTLQNNNRHSLTGSLSVTQGITGSLFGTASFAINAISSSFPIAVTGSTIYSVEPASNLTPNVNNNIFLGSGAGDLTTNASSSNFLGYNAGGFAINANSSNFIGYEAGFFATNANNSNFIGSYAGGIASFLDGNATNAYNSNFFGGYAGASATNANNSNFLGYNAGYVATNANNSNFFGVSAGQSAKSASYSTLIGFNAGRNVAGGALGIKSNNIIIGTNITLEDGRQDSINLGGLIFGTGSYSTTTGNPFSGYE